VTPESRLEVRKIALGMESADRVEVKSGLKEGEMVVVAGRASLKAGGSGAAQRRRCYEQPPKGPDNSGAIASMRAAAREETESSRGGFRGPPR